MTQEDKELLLRDLCARLPYGVHCCVLNLSKTIKEDDDILYGVIGDNVITLKFNEDDCLMYYQIKPYLRPISSITEEERAERISILWKLEGHVDEDVTYKYQDWLNKNHFDYRALIPKGLAIAVTNENNPYK